MWHLHSQNTPQKHPKIDKFPTFWKYLNSILSNYLFNFQVALGSLDCQLDGYSIKCVNFFPKNKHVKCYTPNKNVEKGIFLGVWVNFTGFFHITIATSLRSTRFPEPSTLFRPQAIHSEIPKPIVATKNVIGIGGKNGWKERFKL